MIGALIAAATRVMGSGAGRGAVRGALRSEARNQIRNTLTSRFSPATRTQGIVGNQHVLGPTQSTMSQTIDGVIHNQSSSQSAPGQPVDILQKINTNVVALGETIRSLMAPQQPQQQMPDADPAGNNADKNPKSTPDLLKALIGFGAPILATAYEAFKKFLDAVQPYIEDIRVFVGEHIVPFLTEQLPHFFTETLPAFFTVTIPEQFQKAFTTINTQLTTSVNGLKTTINSIRKNVGSSMVALSAALPSIIPQPVRDAIRAQGQALIDQSDAATAATAAAATPPPAEAPVATPQPTATSSGQDVSRATAAQYMDIRPGVDYEGLQTPMKRRLVGMARELFETHGQKPMITSANRTYAQQAALYRTMPPGRAAPPGRSAHEGGSAVDIDSQGQAGRTLFGSGLLDKYGFIRPVRNEPWHVTPKELGGRRGTMPDNPDNPGAPIAVADSSGAPVIPSTGARVPGGIGAASPVSTTPASGSIQPPTSNVPPVATGSSPVASLPNNTGSTIHDTTMALTTPIPPSGPTQPPTVGVPTRRPGSSNPGMSRDITYVPDVDVSMDDIGQHIFYRAA